MKNGLGRNEGIIPLSDFLISILTFNLEQDYPGYFSNMKPVQMTHWRDHKAQSRIDFKKHLSEKNITQYIIFFIYLA